MVSNTLQPMSWSRQQLDDYVFPTQTTPSPVSEEAKVSALQGTNT